MDLVLLLLRVGCQPLAEVGLGDARGHAVRDEVGRHGSDGVLGCRSGAEQAGGGRLRGQDGGRGDLVDLGLGQGPAAGAHLGGEDLLETHLQSDLFDALEVLQMLLV